MNQRRELKKLMISLFGEENNRFMTLFPKADLARRVMDGPTAKAIFTSRKKFIVRLSCLVNCLPKIKPWMLLSFTLFTNYYFLIKL